MYETLRYLEETPCAYQTRENIQSFLESMLRFKLTKTELLTLINNPPTSAVDLQMVIEDLEDRVSEDSYQDIINLSKKYLLPEEADE